MRVLIASCILLFCSLVYSAQKRYFLGDVTDRAKSEENTFAVNENFNDLYLFKVDSAPTTSGRPPCVITDISNPALAEDNQNCLNLNFLALNLGKVDVSTPGSVPRYYIENLLQEPDINVFRINLLFDDIWISKADR